MKEVLQQAIDFAEYCLEELDLSYMASNQAKRLVEKSKEALAKQEHVVWAEFVDRACGLIKAADDVAAEDDYMLDSDNCISVLRGTWKGNYLNDHPQPKTKQEHGSPEDMYVEMHKHLNCPSCGGSGHIDDAKQEQGEPVAWRVSYPNEPELGFWFAEGTGGEGCLNEPLYTAPQQRKPLTDEQDTVSKARYNRVRDDYNELLEKSRLDAIAANRWREHVTHCQLQGVDLDHNFAPQQRKPLTDEQIEKLLDAVIADKKTKNQIGDFARAIEAAHGIKE